MDRPKALRADTIQLAETVLGQPYFSDPLLETALHADPSQFHEDTYNARHLIHTAVLRGLASLRHADRLARNGDFDPTTWQPSDGDLEALRTQLSPAIARIAILNNFDAWMDRTKYGSAAGLWPLQQVAMNDTWKTLKELPKDSRDPNSNFGVSTRFELATGFGKTILALKTAQAAGVGQIIGGSVPVKPRMLYVTSRRHLIRQLKEDAAKHTPDIPVSKLYWVNSHAPDGIAATTYPALIERLERDADFLNNYRGGIVCLDEVHNSLGPLFQEKIEDVKKDTLVLAYTATPSYADGRTVRDLFPHLTSEYDIPTCIQNGAIRGVQLLAISSGHEFTIDTKDLNDDDLALGDFRTSDLYALVDSHDRNTQIADIAQAFVEGGRPAYISCIPGRKCRHSQLLKGILDQRQIVDAVTGETRLLRAEIVNSYLPRAEVKKHKAAFEAGELDVLLDVGLLGEGSHLKGLLAMVLTSPTTSSLRHVQRFGRGLHKDEAQPAVPYTVVAEIFDKLTYIVNESEFVKRLPARYFTSWDIFQDTAFENGVIYEATGKRTPRSQGGNEGQIVKGVKLPAQVVRSMQQFDPELLHAAFFVRTSTTELGPPPEGLAPIGDLIKAAGRYGEMTPEFARKTIKRKLDIDSTLYMGTHHPVFCAPNTKEVIEILKESPILDKPPEGWKNAATIAKKYGLSDRKVRKAIEDLGPTLQSKPFSSKGSRDNEGIAFYPPEDQERIYTRAKPLEDLAPGDHTAKSIADECGTNQEGVNAFFKSRGHTGEPKKGSKGIRTATYSAQQRAAFRDYFYGREVPPRAAFIQDLVEATGLTRHTVDYRLKDQHLGVYVHKGGGNNRFIEAEMVPSIIGLIDPRFSGVIDLDTYAEHYDLEPQQVMAILNTCQGGNEHILVVGSVRLLKPAILPELNEATMRYIKGKGRSLGASLQRVASETVKQVPIPADAKLVRIEGALRQLGWSIESLLTLMRVARIPRQALARDPATNELIMHNEFMRRLINHTARLQEATSDDYTLAEAAEKLHMNTSDLFTFVTSETPNREILRVLRKNAKSNSPPTAIDVYLSAQSIVHVAYARQKPGN